MKVRVSVAGSVNTTELSKLFEGLQPVNGLGLFGDLEFDFSELESVSPPALALILATLQDLGKRGLCDPTTCCVPPVAKAPQKWLSRSALQELLGGRNPTPKAPPIVEGCSPFKDGDYSQEVAAGLVRELARASDLSMSMEHSIETLIAELAENVLKHSGAGRGVAAAWSEKESNAIEVAVADRGIGIRGSLAHNQAYRDLRSDLEAIRRAQGPGVTEAPGRARGMGLYLARIVVSENEGGLTICSGDAIVPNAEKYEGSTSIDQLPPYPGTVVAARIRTDRSFDYELVERVLESPGGRSG